MTAKKVRNVAGSHRAKLRRCGPTVPSAYAVGCFAPWISCKLHTRMGSRWRAATASAKRLLGVAAFECSYPVSQGFHLKIDRSESRRDRAIARLCR